MTFFCTNFHPSLYTVCSTIANTKASKHFPCQCTLILAEAYNIPHSSSHLPWHAVFVQVTANHSISLAQFDYTVEFEEEYREAIASGEYPGVIMTIVLKRKINYHLLQTYLPSGNSQSHFQVQLSCANVLLVLNLLFVNTNLSWWHQHFFPSRVS